MKVLYWFGGWGDEEKRQPIKECEVIQETEKTFKIKHFSVTVVRKECMSTNHYTFAETYEEAKAKHIAWLKEDISYRESIIKRNNDKMRKSKETLKVLYGVDYE